MSPTPEEAAVRPFAGGAEGSAPAFNEAWHAQALAIADTLIRAGLIKADAWSAALGQALETTQARQDDEAAYYAAVMSALETLTANLEGVGGTALEHRTEAWREAYLSTPHGEPVALSNRPDDE